MSVAKLLVVCYSLAVVGISLFPRNLVVKRERVAQLAQSWCLRDFRIAALLTCIWMLDLSDKYKDVAFYSPNQCSALLKYFQDLGLICCIWKYCCLLIHREKKNLPETEILGPLRGGGMETNPNASLLKLPGMVNILQLLLHEYMA